MKKIMSLLYGVYDSDPRVWRSSREFCKTGNYTLVAVFEPSIFCVTPFMYEQTPNDSLSPDVLHIYRYESPGSSRISKIFSMFTNFFSAFRQLKKYDIDIYYANDLNALPMAWLLSVYNGKELIYDSHELYPDIFEEWYLKYPMRLLEGILIRRPSHVITVNDSISRVLKNRYYLKSDPIVVKNVTYLYNGSDVDDKLSSGDISYKMIYVGGFKKDMRYDTFLMALKYIDPKIHMYFQGGGSERGYIKHLIDVFGLQDRVHFIPTVPMQNIVSSLVGYDVGVILYDGDSLNVKYSLPNKLFEYMMAGNAVLAPHLEEIEYVCNMGCGKTCRLDSDMDIVRVINELYADPEKLIEMKRMARKLAIRKYNWEWEGAVLRCVV